MKRRGPMDPCQRHDCYLCGRNIRWYGAKRYARHRCPHGTWCPSGRPGGAQGINTPFQCPPCMKMQRAREAQGKFERVRDAAVVANAERAAGLDLSAALAAEKVRADTAEVKADAALEAVKNKHSTCFCGGPLELFAGGGGFDGSMSLGRCASCGRWKVSFLLPDGTTQARATKVFDAGPFGIEKAEAVLTKTREALEGVALRCRQSLAHGRYDMCPNCEAVASVIGRDAVEIIHGMRASAAPSPATAMRALAEQQTLDTCAKALELVLVTEEDRRGTSGVWPDRVLDKVRAALTAARR